MIRKLKSGGYRLYSRKTNPKTGRRRNLGTFKTRAAAEKHEQAVQYFKRHSGDRAPRAPRAAGTALSRACERTDRAEGWLRFVSRSWGMAMRVITMSCALVAVAVLAGAAAVQNNPGPSSGRSSGGAQTSGQSDSTTGQVEGLREAPVGHRQPRARDLPAAPNAAPPIRSPEEQDVDRKLRICRDC